MEGNKEIRPKSTRLSGVVVDSVVRWKLVQRECNRTFV